MRDLRPLFALLAAGCTTGGGSLPDSDGDDDSAEATPARDCVPQVPEDDRTVHTAAGPVQGVEAGGALRFRGLAFAAPPTGSLRFRAPEPPACVEELRVADLPGNRCPQLDDEGALVGDEDCLFLDLYLPGPAVEPEGRRPVLFFVHGGGNVQGSADVSIAGDVPLYDGGALAERFGAIVVVTQYRLGALGWLSHPDLVADAGPGGGVGNLGLLDQQAALRWVRDESSGFGGDPERVLLFGESAGAVDTCAHLHAPGSAGLFTAALMQSGGCNAPPVAEAQIVHTSRVESIGCVDDDVVPCLRAASVADLVSLAPPVVTAGVVGGDGFGPIVDGDVLPTDFDEAAALGTLAPVPIILGNNADESAQWVPVGLAEEDYLTWLDAVFGPLATAIGEIYSVANFGTPRLAKIQLTTDLQFHCPTRRIARALAEREAGETWRYFFALASDPPGPAPPAAFHGLELVYVFQRLAALQALGQFDASTEQEDAEAAIGGYWTSLAATGVPSASGSADWTAYDPAVDNSLVIAEEIRMEAAVRGPRCGALDALLD